MLRTHHNLHLTDLTDPDERAFYQIINELGSYMSRLKKAYQDCYATPDDVNRTTNLYMILAKHKAAIFLLRKIIWGYAYHPDVNQRKYYGSIPGQNDKVLIRFSVEDQERYEATQLLYYPQNDNEKDALRQSLRAFRDSLLYGRNAEIVETRRNSSIIISIILNILNILSFDKIGRIHGRDVINNSYNFFNQSDAAKSDPERLSETLRLRDYPIS